ncbi:aKG-HExxH-type peptide beta-hydroxylase [Kitasatospora sp. NPDC088548]|uniref:aKG-HExxH-type peptide beta-hydroxylase n=1 Tax=Kitasatospora sp. NPDC088548 TaxID=3364075 RepID=UPI00381C1FF2
MGASAGVGAGPGPGVDPGAGAGAGAGAGVAAGVPGARVAAELPRHGLDRAVFMAIAAARGGPEAVRALRAGQVSKRALLLLALERALPDGPGRADFEQAYAELRALRATDPPRWEEILLRPELDAWTADCLRGLTAGEAVAPGVLGEFVRAGRRGEPVPLECDGLRWTPVIDHLGPYRASYGRPTSGPLEAAELAAWRDALAQAWRILATRHHRHAQAVAACVTTLVPLRPAPGGEAVSAAARRAYGSVAASRPDDPVLLALALVHEFLHIQLGALLDLVPLHRPNGAAVYHAPWRPDPRPVGALLQGAYAHLGVAGFWHAELVAGASDQDRAERESSRWRAHTAAAVGTLLDSGELTTHGRDFVSELGRAVRRLG